MSVSYATVGGRLVREVRNSVITRYVSDPLGSVVQTRNSAGTLTSSTEFWPFGEVRTSSGTNPSPWGFVGTLGYFTDLVSRLYVRARYYRTNLSRWMTVDPLWPGLAGYLYAFGRPVSATDSSGLCAENCCGKACNDYIARNPKFCDKEHPNAPGYGIGGFAYCCDGNKCACPCPGKKPENPILYKCFVTHEEAHLPGNACPKGYVGVGIKPPNTGTECAAQMAEIICLWSSCEGKNLISNDCIGATRRRCWLCHEILKATCGKNLRPGFFEKYCGKCH